MNLHLAIERLRDVLRRQPMALATESTYVHWLRQYMTALNSMPATLGEVLRHQLAQTTEIYAKVDVTALRALAQPWLGGAR